MFSKLDEHLDNIYIPYYNRKQNRIANYKPDFVFWLKKGKDYYIIFIDPKSTTYTDYEYKVDGYKTIFEKKSQKQEFKYKNYKIKVFLYLFTDDKSRLSDEYKKYWFDSFKQIGEEITLKT